MKLSESEICQRIMKVDNERIDRMTKAILEVKDSDEPIFLKFNLAIRNECKDRTNDS